MLGIRAHGYLSLRAKCAGKEKSSEEGKESGEQERKAKC